MSRRVPVNDSYSRLNALEAKVKRLWSNTTQTVFDSAGVQRVAFGLLPNGDYGLQFTDPYTGATQELIPGADDFETGPFSTASTTPVALAGSPTVSCMIGASGDARVTIGAAMVIPASCQGSLSLTGSRVSGSGGSGLTTIGGAGMLFGMNWTSTAMTGPQSYQTTTRLNKFSGLLAPGEWEFGVDFRSTNGSTQFSDAYLSVQPL